MVAAIPPSTPGACASGQRKSIGRSRAIPEVLEAIAVAQDWEGDQRIVLFVRLRPGVALLRRAAPDHPPAYPHRRDTAARAGADHRHCRDPSHALGQDFRSGGARHDPWPSRSPTTPRWPIRNASRSIAAWQNLPSRAGTARRPYAAPWLLQSLSMQRFASFCGQPGSGNSWLQNCPARPRCCLYLLMRGHDSSRAKPADVTQ